MAGLECDKYFYADEEDVCMPCAKLCEDAEVKPYVKLNCINYCADYWNDVLNNTSEGIHWYLIVIFITAAAVIISVIVVVICCIMKKKRAAATKARREQDYPYSKEEIGDATGSNEGLMQNNLDTV